MGLFLRLMAAAAALSIPAAANAAWHEARSKHFIIYADQPTNELRSFAERLERFDQAVRLLRKMPDPQPSEANLLRIFVVPNERDVGGWASGAYRSSAAGTIAIVPRKAGIFEGELGAGAIFFHEYAHHLQLQQANMVLPGWVSEGFAEFFATARVEKDGGVTVGLPPNYRGWAIFNAIGLSFEQMLGVTHGQLDWQQTELLYAKGWLLTHYLTFHKARSGQLDRYVAGIQRGLTGLDAAKAAFGDLKTLSRELGRYQKGPFTAVRVNGNEVSPGPIAIRPLTAGEAAMMPIHFRSRRGVTERTAPDVAADARKAAESFPSDPFVQATLAEAEHDAHNYVAAAAAADRALAIAPKNVDALVYKGRALMELAKANPQKADWKEIRSWFSKANKLDTENAEVLMLYFQTFVHEGARPTRNAIDGLLYAVQLAPRDDAVRLIAVRQLLVDGRIAEARELFSTLAFDPHLAGDRREASAAIMSAITAGNASQAVSLLDAEKKRDEAEAKKR